MQHYQLPTLLAKLSPVKTRTSSRFDTDFVTCQTRNWTTLVFAIALTTIFCRPLSAQVDTSQSTQTQVDPASIQRQIALLGDTDPSVRKKAQDELRQLGSVAIGELEKAAKFQTTRDYETQIAAAKILESIRDEIAINETDNFVRGKTTLPGWQTFEKYAGSSPESRSLFRDIYLRNRTELTRALRPSNAGNFASYGELRKLFESLDLEQACFGLFLLAHQQTQQNAAQSDAELSPLYERPSQQQLMHLLNALARTTSPLTKARSDIEPAAKLVRAVIETAPPDYPILSRKLALVQQINSSEIGPLLVKFAASENPTVVRALAIAHAIKIGDAATFAELQSYLNDNAVVGSFLTAETDDADKKSKDKPAKQLITTVQIRDIVLLGNLRLAGKDHTDFGFDAKAVKTSGKGVDVKQAGFINNEDREKAFDRYQASSQ